MDNLGLFCDIGLFLLFDLEFGWLVLLKIMSTQGRGVGRSQLRRPIHPCENVVDCGAMVVCDMPLFWQKKGIMGVFFWGEMKAGIGGEIRLNQAPIPKRGV